MNRKLADFSIPHEQSSEFEITIVYTPLQYQIVQMTKQIKENLKNVPLWGIKALSLGLAMNFLNDHMLTMLILTVLQMLVYFAWTTKRPGGHQSQLTMGQSLYAYSAVTAAIHKGQTQL